MPACGLASSAQLVLSGRACRAQAIRCVPASDVAAAAAAVAGLPLLDLEKRAQVKGVACAGLGAHS